jgi:CheY-like chemotaxis protein
MAELPRLCVLVVEDHDDTLNLLQRMLVQHGYAVHPARSAVEAVGLARQNKCDVVVSDVGMPVHDGLELMRVLKRRYGLKGIAVSGYAGSAALSAAKAAGFDRHLAKPMDLPQLFAAIEELVG